MKKLLKAALPAFALVLVISFASCSFQSGDSEPTLPTKTTLGTDPATTTPKDSTHDFTSDDDELETDADGSMTFTFTEI